MKTEAQLIEEICTLLRKPFSLHCTGSVWIVREIYHGPGCRPPSPYSRLEVGYGESLKEALEIFLGRILKQPLSPQPR